MPAFCGDEGTKGASSKAYEHASENSIFNRVSDWFATVGKSDEEKAKILAERRAKRAAKQTEKEAKKAEKEARKAQKEVEKKAKKASSTASEAVSSIAEDDDSSKGKGWKKK